jgi:hypothetical protein
MAMPDTQPIRLTGNKNTQSRHPGGAILFNAKKPGHTVGNS